MKNIIVAVDTDVKSSALVDYATVLGEKFESKLWIVHIANPETGYAGLAAAPQYIKTGMDNEYKVEHKLLHDYVARVQEKGLEAEGVFMVGATVELIVDEVHKLNSDLIVIGTHIHSGFHNVLFGNLHESTIRKAGIPVLVVPVD